MSGQERLERHLHAFRVGAPGSAGFVEIGIPGHYRMLEVLSDPNNEEHEEVLEWLGGNYDPNDFAPPKVRFDDPRKRWRMAFSEN